MKITVFLLLCVEVYLAQIIPHYASLNASKNSVFSTEEFMVTYSVSGLKGYMYIGLMDDYFEAVGTDRWEGEIKDNEVKKISFNVRLKDIYKNIMIKESYHLAVGFSFQPFDSKITGGSQFKSIMIHISDFKQIKEKAGKDSSDVKKVNDSNIYPLPADKINSNDQWIPDPDCTRLEFQKK